VAAVAASERERLREGGIELRCERALVRLPSRVRAGAPAMDLTTDAGAVLSSRVDVIVEAMGGVEPARTLVSQALTLGIPVVTANKSLVAAHGPELRALAARHDVPFLFEAAALSGVPCLGALARRPLAASVRTIAAVLNGTTHFILNAVAGGATFRDALAEAQARGYAEPDSTADISGRDAAEKLTILLHLAGCAHARTNALTTRGIDAIGAADFRSAAALGGTIKPVALATIGACDHDESGAWVGPGFVPSSHLFARLDGVTNAIALRGDDGRASCFLGPGAGPAVTAATIIDDVVEAATSKSVSQNWYVARTECWSASDSPAEPRSAPRTIRNSATRSKRAGSWKVSHDEQSFASPARSAWFIRLTNSDAFSVRDVAEFLAAHHVPALQIVAEGGAIAARTVDASWATIREAAEALDACGAGTLVLPVLGAEAQA
jgi:homoserine dehydrogenase